MALLRRYMRGSGSVGIGNVDVAAGTKRDELQNDIDVALHIGSEASNWV